MLTLTQAAEEVGRTRSTLFKAIKAGRLSATKDAQGHLLIDPAELYRVYVAVNVSQGNQSKQGDIVNDTSEIAFLRRENELLRQQAERDREQLARERENADKWRNQATMLLTHQPEPERPVKSRLYEKLFGRK
ncbi:MAG: hypothetical protein WCP96_11405 [Methylococcaceae bacterium]